MKEADLHLQCIPKDHPNRDKIRKLWKTESNFPSMELPEKYELKLREELERKYGN